MNLWDLWDRSMDHIVNDTNMKEFSTRGGGKQNLCANPFPNRISKRIESNRIESNRIEAWFCSTFFEGQCVLVHKCTCSTPICGVTSPTDPNNSNYRLGLLVSIVIAASTSDDGGW
mmetsp:Transcript_57970/g.141638  ORF Transcript_57970/g.141638 Transcript_57970/m.141638 type:complete len:116 (+) Transcript_57970:795-1142(+)